MCKQLRTYREGNFNLDLCAESELFKKRFSRARNRTFIEVPANTSRTASFPFGRGEIEKLQRVVLLSGEKRRTDG